MFSSVLAGFDGSRHALDAVGRAAEIAETERASLTLGTDLRTPQRSHVPVLVVPLAHRPQRSLRPSPALARRLRLHRGGRKR